MKNTRIDIVNRIFNAIDSDDLETLADHAESDLDKTCISQLKHSLVLMEHESSLNFDKRMKIKHFLRFL